MLASTLFCLCLFSGESQVFRTANHFELEDSGGQRGGSTTTGRLHCTGTLPVSARKLSTLFSPFMSTPDPSLPPEHVEYTINHRVVSCSMGVDAIGCPTHSTAWMGGH